MTDTLNHDLHREIDELIAYHTTKSSQQEGVRAEAHDWLAKLGQAALEGLVLESPETPETQSYTHDRDALNSDEELPEDIKNELLQFTTNQRSELGRAISEWLDDFTEVARIDDVIKGLYRQRGMKTTREQVARKLTYLSARGLIRSVPGVKGGYVSNRVGVNVDESGVVTVTFDDGRTRTYRTTRKGNTRRSKSTLELDS